MAALWLERAYPDEPLLVEGDANGEYVVDEDQSEGSN